jgi:hypothetical protein
MVIYVYIRIWFMYVYIRKVYICILSVYIHMYTAYINLYMARHTVGGNPIQDRASTSLDYLINMDPVRDKQVWLVPDPQLSIWQGLGLRI